jgi:hypothetical protein
MYIEMVQSAKSGFEALVQHHLLLSRALILAMVFLYGYLEAAVYKWRVSAFITWLLGLCALSVMIGYPPTTLRTFLGAITLLLGLVLILSYFKKGR